MKILIKNGICSSIAVVFLSLGAIVPANAATISFNQSNRTFPLGEFFTLDIRVTDVTDLYAFQFNVGFNSSVIRATSNFVSEGSFLPSGGATFFDRGTLQVGGTITAISDSLSGAVAGVNGSGVLTRLSFLASAQGTSDISVFSPVLLNSNLEEIPVNGIANSRINVVPIPAASVLFGSGLIALFGASRRKKKAV